MHPPHPLNAHVFLMVRMTFPRRGAENLVHNFVPTRRVTPTCPSSPFSKCSLNQVISIGRGGAGNILSPSRDVVRRPPSELSSVSETQQIEYERRIIRNREAARAKQPGGRGGVGNAVRRDSQSQSLFRSRPRGSETPATSQIGHGTNDLASQGTPKAHRHARKLVPGRSFLGRRPREILNATRVISNLCQRNF